MSRGPSVVGDVVGPFRVVGLTATPSGWSSWIFEEGNGSALTCRYAEVAIAIAEAARDLNPSAPLPRILVVSPVWLESFPLGMGVVWDSWITRAGRPRGEVTAQ